MPVIRHPELADDIHEVATDSVGVSGRVLGSFWKELASALTPIQAAGKTS
jgi:hypothetical protein